MNATEITTQISNAADILNIENGIMEQVFLMIIQFKLIKEQQNS